MKKESKIVDEKMLVIFNGRKMIEGIDYKYISGSPGSISFYGILRGPLWLRMLFAVRPARLRKSDIVEIHYECEEVEG